MRSFMNWSGGKDSALALFYANKNGLDPAALNTNVNAAHNRISMHGIRKDLLEEQAKSINLPLHIMELPEMPAMHDYENIAGAHFRLLKTKGYTDAVFGDIFLEDLKHYREEQLKPFDITCHFPLWKKDPRALMLEFIGLGFKAITVCINDSVLDKSFCGRIIDESFMADLPEGVDICGENGEYHSFVFDGPLFRQPVSFVKGELIRREYPGPRDKGDDCFTDPTPPAGFYFCDLIVV